MFKLRLLRIIKEKHGIRWYPKHVQISFYWWSNSCHFGFDTDIENGTFHIALPPLSLFATFPFLRTRNWKFDSDREISVGIHSWAIWWNFWTSHMSWDSKTPRYRKGAFHLDDFFLGKAVFSKNVIETREVAVPMPEGTYDAVVALSDDTWKRPRWPFPRVIRRADIKVEKGIPHPGKGENSWDCGDDDTYGMCAPARTIPEAVGHLVGSCLKDRVRYGGYSKWTWPKEKVTR